MLQDLHISIIMYKHKEVFDLSNQRKDSKYYCNDNKKVPEKNQR